MSEPAVYTDDATGRAQRAIDEVAAVETPADAALKLLALAGDAQAAEAPLRQLRKALEGSDPLRRAVVREQAVVALKGKAGSAAGLVDAAIGPDPSATGAPANGQQGRALAFADVEPYPDPVVGAELLDALVLVLNRFLALPSGAAVAIALWAVFAHVLDAFTVAPILALLSAVKRSGKTTALLLLARLVPRASLTSSLTPAVLFRAVERFTPTLLADEADTWLRDDRHELRGIFNSGHTRDTAAVLRCDGDAHEPATFSTWCAKALGAIGRLPDTIADRSIIVNMRRRAPDENVERLRLDRIGVELEPLRRQAARWAADHLGDLRAADPAVPAELHDRAADSWRPLLAIADLAGGEWPKKAREAAIALSGGGAAEDGSVGVLLLADLSELFEERKADRLPSATIVEALARMEDRPWPEWRNDLPITVRQLARLLRPFEIKPKKFRPAAGEDPCQGYEVKAFEDPFRRYLPPTDPEHRNKPSGTGTFADSASGTGTPAVPDRESRNLKRDGLCSGVPDRKGRSGAGDATTVALERAPTTVEAATDSRPEPVDDSCDDAEEVAI